jgi:hypothetical protein
MPSWAYSVPGTGGGGGGNPVEVQAGGIALTSAVEVINFLQAAIATAVGNDVTVTVYGAVADVIANRPAAGATNDFGVFYATDTEIIYISDGTTWTAVTLLPGSITGFNEAAQDTVGGILTDTTTIDLVYNDGANTITANVVTGSIGPTQLEATAVTPNPYGSATAVATFTVDADGRLTAAATVDIAIPSTAITDFTEAAQDAVGGMVADTATIDLTYTDGTPSLTADYIGAWKQSVRVATITAGTLATSFENGDTVDGIVLATNDRILIKDQAAGAENGIYTVNASGAPTRSADFDVDSEALGAVIMVSEGTRNKDSIWKLTNNATITIGTTALVFTRTDAYVNWQVFDSSANYELPAGAAAIYYRLVGAGAGGGEGREGATNRFGGSGGGAGGVADGWVDPAQIGPVGTTVAVTIGAGGPGGDAKGGGDGESGTLGGATTFGTFGIAGGGGAVTATFLPGASANGGGQGGLATVLTAGNPGAQVSMRFSGFVVLGAFNFFVCPISSYSTLATSNAGLSGMTAALPGAGGCGGVDEGGTERAGGAGGSGAEGSGTNAGGTAGTAGGGAGGAGTDSPADSNGRRQGYGGGGGGGGAEETAGSNSGAGGAGGRPGGGGGGSGGQNAGGAGAPGIGGTGGAGYAEVMTICGTLEFTTA